MYTWPLLILKFLNRFYTSADPVVVVTGVVVDGCTKTIVNWGGRVNHQMLE